MLQRSIASYRDSFRDLTRETWVLSAVTLINRSGTMVIPFLSVYLKTVLGFSLMQVGWVLASFGCGSMLGSFLGGRLTDRFGHYYIQFWSLFLSGWFYISLIWVKAFEHWVIAVFLLSVITDSFRPATMAAIADYSSEGTRTRSISLIRLAINLGWTTGPAVGGFVAATLGYTGLFILDGLTCLFASLVFIRLLQNPGRSRPAMDAGADPKSVSRSLPKRSYFIFLFFHLLVLLSFMQLFISFPVYFKEHLSLDEFRIGLLMALNGFLVLVIEMPLIYYLENKAGILKWIALGAGLIGLTFLLLFLFPHWPMVVIFAMISLSLGEIFYLPFSNSYALAQSSPENRGSYMGWYAMAGSGAFILASVVGNQFTSLAGYPALWILLTLICLASVIAWFVQDRA
jgi:predicted MFS family arabinose efflux permease